MLLGTVIEQVWMSKVPSSWRSHRLLAVRVRKCDGTDGAEIVAADTLGAAVGQQVLVASSSRVRDRVVPPGSPIKSVIVAIVDDVDVPSSFILAEPGKLDLRLSDRRLPGERSRT